MATQFAHAFSRGAGRKEAIVLRHDPGGKGRERRQGVVDGRVGQVLGFQVVLSGHGIAFEAGRNAVMAIGFAIERLEACEVQRDLLGHAGAAHAYHRVLQEVGDPGLQTVRDAGDLAPYGLLHLS